MKKGSILSTKAMAEIGIFAALGYVLDFLAGTYSKGLFVNGGSIGIALICVYIISFRRGIIAGTITGLIMGLLDIADGFYSIADNWNVVLAQVLLDYVVAYPAAGFGAGLFRKLVVSSKNKSQLISYASLGCVFGGLLKLLMHFLSGYLFWGEYPAWEEFINQPALYSFLYNGAYMLPCIVLSTIVIDLVGAYQPQLLIDYNSSFFRKNNSNKEAN